MKTFSKSSLLILALLLCAWRAQPAPQGRAAGDNEGRARSTALFNERCARCHGEDGRGQTVIGGMVGAPDFTDQKWWDEGKDERRFLRSISEGRGAMPAFGRKLTPAEIRALAAYVRTFRESDR